MKQRGNPNFGKLNFRGRYSNDEKQRIFQRLSELYKQKLPKETMLTVMQVEGFRRVDGSDLTLSWIIARLQSVTNYYKSESTRHKSGPVKVVYQKPIEEKKQSPQNSSTTDLMYAVLESNISSDHKLELIRILGRE